MDNLEIVEMAERLLHESKFAEAEKLLRPLVILEFPAALFLAATFSVAGSETDAEFESRSIDYLTRAANYGYPAALYSLGVCYDIGDMVELDTAKAGLLFRQAAEAGYLNGKFCHGRNLYYGSNGIETEPEKGLALIQEAANRGLEAASDFLNELHGKS